MILVVVEVDFDRFGDDAVEEARYLDSVVWLVVFQAERQRCCAAVECVEGFTVSLVVVFHHDIFAHKPVVAFFFRAADVRIFARFGVKPWDILQIFSAIVRPYLETFGCFPDKFLVVIGSFEVFFYDSFPLFGGYWRKFLKKFLVVTHDI